MDLWDWKIAGQGLKLAVAEPTAGVTPLMKRVACMRLPLDCFMLYKHMYYVAQCHNMMLHPLDHGFSRMLSSGCFVVCWAEALEL